MRAALPDLARAMASIGIKLTVTSAVRSRAEQARLYRALAGRGAVAPPGKSKHQYGRAVDIRLTPATVGRWPFRQDSYEIAGEYWEELGGKWGGRFKPLADAVHFEDSSSPP